MITLQGIRSRHRTSSAGRIRPDTKTILRPEPRPESANGGRTNTAAIRNPATIYSDQFSPYHRVVTTNLLMAKKQPEAPLPKVGGWIKITSGCVFSMEALEIAARSRCSPENVLEAPHPSRPRSPSMVAWYDIKEQGTRRGDQGRRGSQTPKPSGKPEANVPVNQGRRGSQTPKPSGKPEADQETEQKKHRRASNASRRSGSDRKSSELGMEPEAPATIKKMSSARTPSIPLNEASAAIDASDMDKENATNARRRLSLELREAGLSFRTPRQERMQKITRMSNAKAYDKAKQVARSAEFEAIPVDERNKLSETFAKHANQDSNIIDSVDDLQSALGELGLKPAGSLQEEELKEICQRLLSISIDLHALALDVVPFVRKHLIQVQAQLLVEKFKEYDSDGNGQLDEAECKDILKKLCGVNMDRRGSLWLEKEFKKIFHDCRGSGQSYILIEQFDEFMRRVVEVLNRIKMSRETDICVKEQLNPSQRKRHADELLLLYDSFQRGDTNGDGVLDEEETHDIMMSHGLTMEISQEEMQRIFKECSVKGVLNFRGFLNMVHQARAVNHDRNEETLQELFDHYDKDKSGQLEGSELWSVLDDLGLMPKSVEDQKRIKELLEEIDVNNDGVYSYAEYLHMIRKIDEKQKSLQIHRELKLAAQLGFSDAQVKELRSIFVLMDIEGESSVSFDELHKSFKLLKHPVSKDKLQETVRSLADVDSGKLDFPSFLKLARKVNLPLVAG